MSSPSQRGREGRPADVLRVAWPQGALVSSVAGEGRRDCRTADGRGLHLLGPSGMVLDRQAILAVVRSPSYRLDHGRRTEVGVRLLGHEAAVVRHRYQGAGSFDGTSFTDDHRCVMVWHRTAGEWRVHFEQASPIVL